MFKRPEKKRNKNARRWTPTGPTVQKDRCEVPWREWLGGVVAPTLDREASDIAAITLVLRSLHCKGNADAAPVSVSYGPSDNSRRVTVTNTIKKGQLELFPCAPKSTKISKTSTHPDRVAFHVQQICEHAAVAACASKRGDGAAATAKSAGGRAASTKESKALSKDGVDGAASKTGGDASTKGGGAAAESYTYYLHPEYKLPEDVTDASTEADAPGTRLWRWYGDESMYPFWAVERATDAWVQKTNTESKDGVQLAFNVERKEMTFNCVTVGAVQGSSVAITVNVRLPVLTNTHDMTAGTRLLLEKAAKVNPEKRKAETWKTDVDAAAKAQKQEPSAKSKAQAKTKATQKGGASTLCVNI